MKKELDEALVRDFPNLYRDRAGSMYSTAMCWGFDVGDGWEPLIRRLSEKLEAEIVKMLDSYEDEEPTSVPAASQVKEKFGGLRFYMTSGTDAMYAAIHDAELESLVTCEVCGARGDPRDGSWVRTLCEEHASKT